MWFLAPKVATLGCEDFTTASKRFVPALSILHGSYRAHAGTHDIERLQRAKRKHFVRESLTLRRSAGGSESKSRSSSLDVDSLMTAHWTCLMY
jgi:hypothetical protein